jgi:hypothetical protein
MIIESGGTTASRAANNAYIGKLKDRGVSLLLLVYTAAAAAAAAETAAGTAGCFYLHLRPGDQ